MRIVVVGGTGLIGSKLAPKLRDDGHEAVVVGFPQINTLTGEGIAEALSGADVVVDVTNSPSFDDAAVLSFFTTSTRNLLAAEAAEGVRHHVALSVVGTERLSESGYFRGKIAQEELIKAGPIPYSIVHATQFFEFVKSIADGATVDGKVHLPHVMFQPMAAEEVAATVEKVAAGTPLNATLEIGETASGGLSVTVRLPGSPASESISAPVTATDRRNAAQLAGTRVNVRKTRDREAAGFGRGSGLQLSAIRGRRTPPGQSAD